MTRAPSLFIAHGGPPTLYEVDHPAHKHWLAIGKRIRRLVDADVLKGIVVVSAHWQPNDGSARQYHLGGGSDGKVHSHSSSQASPPPMNEQTLLLNRDAANPLIYDFYNFPKHYYAARFASRADAWLVEAVRSALTAPRAPSDGGQAEAWEVIEVDRGLDHGVWVPLLAAFGEKGMEEIGLPIVQLSLPMPAADRVSGVAAAHRDAIKALHLGRSLRQLRDRGVAVVSGGQPVHNLRETLPRMRAGAGAGAGATGQEEPEWCTAFAEAINDAVCAVRPSRDPGCDDGRWEAVVGGQGTEVGQGKAGLLQRPDYRQAHPTDEHFLPLMVALGAAHADEAGRLDFSLSEHAMNWNMYFWG